EIRARVFETLKSVNLRHKADAYPLRLSGGEQQRVVISRAIVANPAVVLADEPTGNLDPVTAGSVMKTFKDIHAKGTTIVIATHNRELYKNSGKRVLRLDTGVLVGEEMG
ncbi:MAG TPA: ATP-binding cassette domain-containing protein, partial [Candidatus Sulfobium mesophilum]|nr:ATP-binding cassette domain-containing protein [Candidatus Sulfobium mesophilum]